MADEEQQEPGRPQGPAPVGEGGSRPLARAREKLRRIEQTVAGNISVTNVIWDALQHAKTAPADSSGDGWTPLGPRNVGGAIRSLAQDPQQQDIFYAGAAEGGLWRTRDQGNTWESLGESELGITPVSAIAVAPGDRRFVYVGTGENTPNALGGIGLFRSRDAGATFERLADGDETAPTPASGAAFRYARIVVDPQDPNRIWAASSTGLWRFEGTTATLEALGPGLTMITDVALAQSPTNPGDLWLLAAVMGTGVFRGVFTRSTRTTVWAASAGIPPNRPSTPGVANPVGRIRLAFAPSNANTAYALAEDRTSPAVGYNRSFPLPLLQSTDGGATFAYVPVGGTVNWMHPPTVLPVGATERPGQAFYSLELAVDPSNANIVVAGYVNLHRSINGGGTWAPIINWTNYTNHDLRAQHADMHAILFDLSERTSAAPRRLWVGNDGGVSFTEDMGTNWRKRSYGIIGAQFIDITSHPTFPFILGGGMQDNGTFASYGGPTWYRMGGGDGGAMAFHPTDPRLSHTTSQDNAYNATVGTVVAGASSPGRLREVPPPAAAAPAEEILVSTLRNDAPVVTAGLAQTFRGLIRSDHATPGRLLLGRVGGAFLSPDSGTTWNRLGPPLAYTAPLGGGTVDTSALAFHPGVFSANRYYVGTSTGDVFTTVDNGTTWVHTTPFNTGGRQAFISAFAIHPAHAAVMAVAAYATGGQAVMLSHDNGATWVDVSGANQLPPGGVASLAFHPTDARVLFAGTVVGVWVTRKLPAHTGAALPAGTVVNPEWKSFNRGLGPMLVNDLEVVPVTQTLRCATFARGCFEASIRGTDAGGNPDAYVTPEAFRVPPVRLNIRDHAMDDSRWYPPANQLAEDPRLPTGHAAGHLDHTQAIDIKVNAPLFEDRARRFLQSERYGNLPDGSELDEEFTHEPPIAGDTNRIYVQVHNRGHEPANNVQVFLYWANAGNPVAVPDPDPVAIAFPGEPQSGSAWQRAGVQTVGSIKPGQPAVVRFDWTVPLTVRHNLALMAVCHCAQDPLNFAPVADARHFARAERQVALRATPVLYDAVFIRDGLDDFGRRGSVAWGGRTPDILVLRRAEADAIPAADLNSPTGPLGNLLDARAGDRIRQGDDNAIFVRVHNRHDVPVHVDVELYQAPVRHPTTGPWTAIGLRQRASNVQPGTWQVVRFDLTGADPEPTNPAAWTEAYVLGAICRGVDAATGTELDPLPPLPTLTGVDAFWSFFTRGPLATNAALRAVRYQGGVSP
ncbi:WD40/YVTN/BNR-like repeat-containing protein [Pyxidicoccus sp. 3LG]